MAGVTAVHDEAPAGHTSPTGVSARGDEERRRDLARMKRRATVLLIVMTVVFVVVSIFGPDTGWTAYLRATVQAAMVGGLADWFAVTALFRHPLGIPIPHTAVIRERKDAFGLTLGTFVQENFLASDVVAERVRASNVAERVAAWASEEENAATVAGYVLDLAVAVADLVRDEDVHALLEAEAARVLDAVPLAPLAGRALHIMTANGRHQELFDAILRGLERFLDENQSTLRARFGQESPWWLPNAFEDRIFDRLLDGFHEYLRAINRDPNHELRVQFDRRVQELADRLVTSPEMRERGQQLERDFLSHPELRAWTRSIWSDVKTTLRTQASEPTSELRQRVTRAVAAGGRRLRDDPVLLRKADDVVEAAVRYLTEHFRGEITSLVSGTIARWDAEETSDKLELLLGRDLQFIRINGTVVGGLAGLIIYSVGRVL
jgi:uncharacterized membrane-anchored protein YjiN (DUF445 family)